MPLSTYNILLKLIYFIFLISNVYCLKSNESESNVEPIRLFIPVDIKWQQSKCQELDIPFIRVSNKEMSHKYLKSPKSLIETKGDGSCFFNALSYWITGSNAFGQELRKKIIDFLADSKNFQIMTVDYKRQERIDEMYDSTVYAESSEIAAAAEYLKTSIYVYTDENGWHFFNKINVFGNDDGEKCIYLINESEHYMPVIDVYGESISLFLPVDVQWQISKCNELGLSLIRTSSNDIYNKILSYPKTDVKTVLSDGSFFNALSFWITGSIKFGKKLRKKIVDFLKESKSYKRMISDDKRLARIEEMNSKRVYAESSEIAAAAEYLKTSIYVYTDENGWQFFKKDDVLENYNGEKCIYLINDKEHYKPVVDVYPESASSNPT
ncbi:uncharacterized protein LOC126908132 isoform X2 [Daktulosphaira vitifoliae]|uniref:uncharacterized protein LOC126908132 isoform X2 n=1 Tax=Daktulosphaira vitifoliae TaxID=58002 RepID=UPI0021A9955C|nr:uncharacterized protein LOC126908132 isoform X2 [Daktulosphaira vitifoliae]XP_050546002.1 uncharacterized protein LOC126908132 isoform X2 [Daktulosphaira vitifoliae]XP_050546010.1 uncharacterized protein LOC126908132 isoform X2 [Daktulosphaira vitifoliae]